MGLRLRAQIPIPWRFDPITVETFKQAMRCLLEERQFNETDWPTLVKEVTYTCNSYFNASTGCSPHEVMYVGPLRSKAHVIFPSSRPRDFPSIQSFCKHTDEARHEVAERDTRTSRALSRLWRGSIIVDLSEAKLNQETGSGSEMMRPHSLSPIFRGPWLVAERRGVKKTKKQRC